jgi:hypothetical protein
MGNPSRARFVKVKHPHPMNRGLKRNCFQVKHFLFLVKHPHPMNRGLKPDEDEFVAAWLAELNTLTR